MEPSAPRHGNTPDSSRLCDDCKALQFDDSALGGFIGESATGAPMLKIKEEPRMGYRTGARKPLWVQNRSDFAPDFPGLRRASQAGCGFCGYLRGSLMKGQPLSDLGQRRRIDMALCYAWAPRRPDNLVNVHDGESEGLQALAVYFDDGLALKSGVLYFGIYSEDRPAADWLGLYEPPHAKPLCVENISSMKTALEHCSSTCHPRESAAYIPTRLLDLGRDLGEEPRLIITADLAVSPQGVVEPLDYATLSYCWGDKDDGAAQTKTDPLSLQQRLRGIQPSEMSRVLQDAITVCRAFSVRYLWVDALCIIQDEEDTSDWEKESDRVGEVYEHAYFTICAASTTSCHQSFLDRQDSFDFPFQSSLQPEARGTLKLVYTGHHHLELSSDHNPLAADRRSSLWYTRGWVYQERYLSSRRLIFGRHMLHFECGEIEFSENGECVRPNIVDWSARATNDTSQSGIYSHFRSQVGVYAAHSLTYESDRLSALSGIAKKVFDRTGDTYLAGIWKQDLHVGLLWNSCNIGGNLAELLNSFKDHTNRAAPSWSWASLPGYLTYGISGINVNHQQRHLRPEYHAIDGWTELQGAQLNRFGAVKNGTIRVVGRMMALSSDYDLAQQNFFDKDLWKVYRGGDLAAYCALDYTGSHPTEEAGSAVILLLSSACRLVGKIPGCYQEYAEAEGSGTSHGDGDGEGNVESESEIEHTGKNQEGSGCGDGAQKLHQDGEEEVEGVGGSEEDDDGDQASVDIDSCALCNNPEHNREASGLILHPANQPGQFYRVGVFLSRPFGAGGTHLFKDVEERRIDII